MSWEIDQGEANVVLADNAFPANLFFQRLPLRQVFGMLWVRNQIPDFHLALVTLALALHHLHSPSSALVLLSRFLRFAPSVTLTLRWHQIIEDRPLLVRVRQVRESTFA